MKTANLARYYTDAFPSMPDAARVLGVSRATAYRKLRLIPIERRTVQPGRALLELVAKSFRA